VSAGDDRVQRVEGVVLRRLPSAEAGWRLAIATRERGLVWATARGARKPANSLAGRVEPFAHNRWCLAPSKGGRSWYVTEAEALSRPSGLTQQLDALSAALALAESVLAFQAQEDPQPEAFDVLLAALDELAKGPPEGGGLSREAHAHAALAVAELALLGALGLGPELHHCLGCQEALGPEAQGGEAVAWGLSVGGALCASCAPQAPGPRKKVPPQAWAWLRAAEAAGPGGGWPRAEERLVRGCRKLIALVVAQEAGRALPAHELLDALPEAGPGQA
jgi:DNA repair protein RecO